jgi:hypothetical protein
MATTIITKYGSGAPTASDVVRGELAVDTENKRLYTEDSGGSVVELGTNPAAAVTFNNDATFTGASYNVIWDSSDSALEFADNAKAIFGAGSDLQIYHDGSNSYVSDQGAGDLYIRSSNDLWLQNAAGTETYARFDEGAATSISYAGSTKLATTSTGIDVTGTVVSDAIQVDTDSGIVLKDGADTRTLTFKIDAGTGRYEASGSSDHFFTTTDSNLARFYIANNGDISFYDSAGTSQSLFWDASAASLGIGTTSPSYQLDVIGTTEKLYARIGDSTNNSFTTTTPVLRLSGDSASNGAGPGLSFFAGVTAAEIYATRQAGGSDGDLRFHTRISGTVAERMRIDDDGALLVGTTTTFPGSVTNVAGMHFGGTTPGRGYFSNDGGRALNLNRMTSDGDIIEFRKDGTSVGSIGASGGTIYAGKGGSGLIFNDGGTKDLIPYSLTAADTVDNSISLGISSKRFKDLYLSGGLRGDTTFSNNAGTTEYARFDSSGNLLVGRSDVFTFSTNTTDGVVLSPSRIDVSAASLCRISQVRDSTGTYDRFYNSSNIVGSITCTTSATAYNTSSDQRLKDNIVDAPSASDDIDAIQVRSFDWKVDGSHQKYGMVAQELVTVAPEAVSQPEDPEEMMGVDYSKLVPMLIKEVQQLRARVAQLEGAN